MTFYRRAYTEVYVVKERFPLAWRLLFFYCKNSITTSNQCGNFVLYTFLEKGGEQDENSGLGNENLKGVHIDGVIEENPESENLR